MVWGKEKCSLKPFQVERVSCIWSRFCEQDFMNALDQNIFYKCAPATRGRWAFIFRVGSTALSLALASGDVSLPPNHFLVCVPFGILHRTLIFLLSLFPPLFPPIGEGNYGTTWVLTFRDSCLVSDNLTPLCRVAVTCAEGPGALPVLSHSSAFPHFPKTLKSLSCDLACL